MKKPTLQVCTKCLMISTRPRLTFDKNGVCSACQWSEEKKNLKIDFKARQEELKQLSDKYKKRNAGRFNVICPASGGKDSSYVAYKLKKELGMHPLVVSINPPLAHNEGEYNLNEFLKRGYDTVRITPNYKVGQKLAKKTFIENGQPMFGFMMAVQAAVLKMAVLFDIPFVMFGEEGETEYGGTKALRNKACYGLEESINIYLSGVNPIDVGKELGFSEEEMYWWTHPTVEEFKKLNPAITHWSYFEDWNPQNNYMLAKEKFGLKEKVGRSVGTYTNFSQLDTKLYDLHTYLMFLKFGFGRCSQDVCIDIRRGTITREEGLELINKYDGEYPEPYIKDYLEYFEMTQEEFDAVIDKWANKDLLIKKDGRWVKNFEII